MAYSTLVYLNWEQFQQAQHGESLSLSVFLCFAAILTQKRHPHLEEAAVFEVVLDDDVRDGVEDESDVVGVRGAGEVGVDLLLVLALVEVLELHLDVGRRVLVRVRA